MSETKDYLPYKELWFSLEDYKKDFISFGKPFLNVVPKKWSKEFETVSEMYETMMLDLQYNLNLYFNRFFEHVNIEQLPTSLVELIKYALYHSFASKLYGVLFPNKNIKISMGTSSGYTIDETFTRESGSHLDIFTPESLKALNATNIKQLMNVNDNDWKKVLILLGELNYDAIYTKDEIDKIIEILKIETENMLEIIGNWVEERLQKFTDNLPKDEEFIDEVTKEVAKNPNLKGEKGKDGKEISKIDAESENKGETTEIKFQFSFNDGSQSREIPVNVQNGKDGSVENLATINEKRLDQGGNLSLQVPITLQKNSASGDTNADLTPDGKMTIWDPSFEDADLTKNFRIMKSNVAGISNLDTDLPTTKYVEKFYAKKKDSEYKLVEGTIGGSTVSFDIPSSPPIIKCYALLQSDKGRVSTSFILDASSQTAYNITGPKGMDEIQANYQSGKLYLMFLDSSPTSVQKIWYSAQ